MSKGVTIVKQGCKKCVTREGTCQLLKISKKMEVKEDKELFIKGATSGVAGGGAMRAVRPGWHF